MHIHAHMHKCVRVQLYIYLLCKPNIRMSQQTIGPTQRHATSLPFLRLRPQPPPSCPQGYGRPQGMDAPPPRTKLALFLRSVRDAGNEDWNDPEKKPSNLWFPLRGLPYSFPHSLHRQVLASQPRSPKRTLASKAGTPRPAIDALVCSGCPPAPAQNVCPSLCFMPGQSKRGGGGGMCARFAGPCRRFANPFLLAPDTKDLADCVSKICNFQTKSTSPKREVKPVELRRQAVTRGFQPWKSELGIGGSGDENESPQEAV